MSDDQRQYLLERANLLSVRADNAASSQHSFAGEAALGSIALSLLVIADVLAASAPSDVGSIIPDVFAAEDTSPP